MIAKQVRLLLAVIAFGVLQLLAPTEARAEGNCPEGYTPARDPGTGVQTGCMPIPGGGGSTGPSAPALPHRPPPPKPSSYVVVYWHPDANDVWAVWNHEHLYDAGFAAYSACTQMMGEGCEKAVEGALMTVLIARTATGKLTQASGKTPETARADLQKYCASQNTTCQVIHEFTASMPKKGRPVAEAFFAGSSAIDRSKLHFAAGYGSNIFYLREKIWLVAGQPSQIAAKKIGGEICWQAEGCIQNDGTRFEIDSGFVLLFKNRYGETEYIDYRVGPDKTELAAQALAACRKATGANCTAGLYLDPRVPYKGEVTLSMLQPWSGLQQATGTLASNQSLVGVGPTGTGPGSGMSHTSRPNPAGGGAYTAQAWIKGDSGVWKFMVWSVSGATSPEAASTAALAECKRDSQLECEVFSETHDTKVALYFDDDHSIRVGRVRYEVDPAPLIRQKCKSEKTTCTIVRIIDSRAPLIERIEVR